jgi:hypothetical protein
MLGQWTVRTDEVSAVRTTLQAMQGSEAGKPAMSHAAWPAPIAPADERSARRAKGDRATMRR